MTAKALPSTGPRTTGLSMAMLLLGRLRAAVLGEGRELEQHAPAVPLGAAPAQLGLPAGRALPDDQVPGLDDPGAAGVGGVAPVPGVDRPAPAVGAGREANHVEPPPARPASRPVARSSRPRRGG